MKKIHFSSVKHYCIALYFSQITTLMFRGFQHLVHKVFFVPESYLKCKFWDSLIHPLVKLLSFQLSDDVAPMWTMIGATCHLRGN